MDCWLNMMKSTTFFFPHGEKEKQQLGCNPCNYGYDLVTWFGTWLLWLSICWECHHPNWRTPSFFRGEGIPVYHQPVMAIDLLINFLKLHCYCFNIAESESQPEKSNGTRSSPRGSVRAASRWAQLIYPPRHLMVSSPGKLMSCVWKPQSIGSSPGTSPGTTKSQSNIQLARSTQLRKHGQAVRNIV